MRLTKVDPAKAEQEVRAAIGGGVMQSNEDMAKMFHDNNNQNGNSQVMLADDNFRISEAFAEWLKERNDPRITIWFQMSDDAGNITTTDIQEFRGLPNGTDAENLEEGEYATFARHNRSTIKDVTNPYFHQSYAEVEFLLAEAALRGWGAPLSVAEHYERGVRAAMDHLNFYTNVTVTPDVIDGYVAANPFQTGTFEEQMQQIHEQLWAALYLDGMEAFANWRRTGYPELTPVDHPIGTTNGTIPRRLYYPPSELANNGENFQAALQRQFGGENELTGRVWWDQ
jgi:hypothetical protein